MITKLILVVSSLGGVLSQCPDVLGGSCAICGSADLCVTKKDAGFAFPGQPRASCDLLELAGLAGVIPLDQCELLPDIISDICGCGILSDADTSGSGTENISDPDSSNENDGGSNILKSSVKTDKLVYEVGEALTVTFTIEEPQRGDWIGIYPSNIDLSDIGNALFWIWVCDRVLQTPCDPQATGNVTFDGSKQVGWGDAISWSPAVGEYLAIAVRNGIGRPWEVISVSPVFRYVLVGDGIEMEMPEMPEMPSMFPSLTSFPTAMPTILSSDTPSQLPSSAPSLALEGSSVTTNKFQYVAGEPISVTFAIENPQRGDWIGIFNAFLDIRDLSDPIYWLWVCDRVGRDPCTSPLSTGTVTFDNSKRIAWSGQRDDWPPAPGLYQAMTVRDGIGSPWEAISVSSSFRVTSV